MEWMEEIGVNLACFSRIQRIYSIRSTAVWKGIFGKKGVDEVGLQLALKNLCHLVHQSHALCNCPSRWHRSVSFPCDSKGWMGYVTSPHKIHSILSWYNILFSTKKRQARFDDLLTAPNSPSVREWLPTAFIHPHYIVLDCNHSPPIPRAKKTYAPSSTLSKYQMSWPALLRMGMFSIL